MNVPYSVRSFNYLAFCWGWTLLPPNVSSIMSRISAPFLPNVIASVASYIRTGSRMLSPVLPEFAYLLRAPQQENHTKHSVCPGGSVSVMTPVFCDVSTCAMKRKDTCNNELCHTVQWYHEKHVRHKMDIVDITYMYKGPIPVSYKFSHDVPEKPY